MQLLIEGAFKEYQNIKSPEQLSYQVGHDSIAIISFFIGLFQFANGVANFARILKKSIAYLKRYGRKGIDKLKGFNKKQLEEVFDELGESNLSQRIKGYSSRFARKVRKSLDDASVKIKDFEKLHTNSKGEFGLIYNPKTKKADVHTSNLSDRIIWPDRLRLKARNSILTHNHPGGTGLSIADIHFFVQNRLREIRAVTPDGEVFSITWKKTPNSKEYGRISSILKEIEKDFELSRLFSVGDEAVSIKREFEAVYKALEDKIDYIHYIK